MQEEQQPEVGIGIEGGFSSWYNWREGWDSESVLFMLQEGLQSQGSRLLMWHYFKNRGEGLNAIVLPHLRSSF